MIQCTADKAFEMKMRTACFFGTARILVTGAFSRRHGEAAHRSCLAQLVKCPVYRGFADRDAVCAQGITKLLRGQMGMRMRLEILQNCCTLAGSVSVLGGHYSCTSMSSTSHCVSRCIERTRMSEPIPTYVAPSIMKPSLELYPSISNVQTASTRFGYSET